MRTRGQIAVKDSLCIPLSRLPLPTGGRRTRPEAEVPPPSMEQVVRLLQEVPLFAGVRAEDLRPLAAACRPCQFRRNEMIFQQGDPGEALHIVQTGQVRIVLVSPQGDEMILALFHPGDFFGELSLVDGHPRSATAVATGPTVTLTLPRPAFLRVLADTPRMAEQTILALSERLRHTDVLLGDAVFLDVAARLAKRLGELARAQGESATARGPWTVRVTQTELAAMVGATRESVNKELRALEAEGLIRVARGRILLLRPGAVSARGDW